MFFGSSCSRRGADASSYVSRGDPEGRPADVMPSIRRGIAAYGHCVICETGLSKKKKASMPPTQAWRLLRRTGGNFVEAARNRENTLGVAANSLINSGDKFIRRVWRVSLLSNKVDENSPGSPSGA